MKRLERKVVVGVGNIIGGDYGLGKHAVRRLQDSVKRGTDIEFIEAGTVGEDMEQLIEECSHLLVLDAVDLGTTPGTIVEFDEPDPHLLNKLHRLPHQTEFHGILENALEHNTFPAHVHMIGVQPGSFSPGFELSGEVNAAIPAVLQRASSVIEDWEH